MSSRLDQPLDSIIDSQKKHQKRNIRRKPQRVAPVGGVKKTVKPAKTGVKPAAGPAPRAPKNSKIIISNMPSDVREAQIKEYFGKSVGPIKKVSLSYNSHGESKGIAEIIFVKPESAAKAAKEQNGLKIDGRPMKIEVVVDAQHVPEPKPVKSLAERVAANPKAQPKSATAVKNDPKDKNKAGKGGKPITKKPRAARPKRKTAEELDAEMTDYWGGNNPSAVGTTEAAAANGAAPAAADAMEEIS